MVVDDSEDIRELLRVQLTRLGYRVVEAADGREAVEAVSRERPDLILMDLSMPVLDGFEATRLIRRIEAARGVVILAFTALGSGARSTWPSSPTTSARRCRPSRWRPNCSKPRSPTWRSSWLHYS